MFVVEVKDSMTPFMKWFQTNEKAVFRRATKSLGWFVQQKIKQGIRSGSPGGVTYKPIPQGFRRLITGKSGRTSFRVLGKLVNAVGYQYENGNVKVGWLSPSAVFFGSISEKGKTVPISDKMRRMFFAHDIYVQKADINIPARPTFDPMFKVIEPLVVPYMEDKLLTLFLNPPNINSSSRKYQVRG